MPSSTPGVIRAVQHTREVARIVSLPRRVWTQESASEVAQEFTSVLRKPGGTMVLRPIQAQALLEIGVNGGGFCPIRVGGGKTLLSGLVPFVLDSRRPVLFLPAKLIEKTKREFRILAQHWPIPNFIRLVSYELLGRVQAQALLDQYQPDVIILDEAHKAGNKKAACTKRLLRYLATHPTCKLVAMSGTIVKRSIKNYAHLVARALGPLEAPVPLSFTELEDWADALDEKTTTDKRIGLGALTLFMSREEREAADELTAARQAYRRRLVETPSVVATTEGFEGSSLTIEALWGDREIKLSPVIDEAFAKLRKEWCAPDGWPLMDPMSVWRVARELSQGFYYEWRPRPPDPWMAARREWAKWCREILTNNRRNLDSELQVTNAVSDGFYPLAEPALAEWRRVRDSFEPNSVPVWLDDSVIRAAALWAKIAPGIVWTEHQAVAEALAKHARLVYYGKRGQDSRGRSIEDHPADESLIASVASNAEGRNLQKWWRNLVTSCPPNGLRWEQMLGRTHRDNQEADEVIFDVVCTSIAHIDAFQQALKDAAYIEASTGQAQKLLYADRLIPEPDDVRTRPGHRWIK